MSSVVQTYERMASWPGGRRLFSWVLGRKVPYTGTIHPQVLTLEPGHAIVRMQDRRSVRNHLGSVHAAALGNLGELVCNLALSSLQPAEGRWIVLGMDIVYLHKARGPIEAEARVEAIDWQLTADARGEFVLRDMPGEVVARGAVRWRVGPREAKVREEAQ